MAKATERILMGSNILFWTEGDLDVFAIDRTVVGHQSKSSKGVTDAGVPKKPNMLVASTGSYTDIPDGDQGSRVMLHYIKPMERKAAITATRKQRALAELESESDSAADSGTLDMLKTAKALAELEGITLSQAVKALS